MDLSLTAIRIQVRRDLFIEPEYNMRLYQLKCNIYYTLILP